MPHSFSDSTSGGLFLQLIIFFVQHVVLSRCALAIAVGDPMRAQGSAPAPSPAPTPATLFPPQSLLPSEEDIEVLRLSFGSIRSSGVLQLPSAPVGPYA